MIVLKRVYAPSAPTDGFRILVERLWPRGVTKAAAGIDLWLKEIAPSPDLRTWYAHDVVKWAEFRRRYRIELAANPHLPELRRLIAEKGTVTFVYAAHDELHNSAVLLKEFLEENPQG
jgi:uncharacterized protein YeaO (DUF488 family)